MMELLAEAENVYSETFHLCQFCTVYFEDLSRQDLGITMKYYYCYFFQQNPRVRKPLKAIFVRNIT